MTTDDQYVPDEMDARGCFLDGAAGAFVREDWEAFLARVRRDAAREAEARIKAVQHLIDQADEMGEWAITCTRLQWAIDGSNPQPGA